MPEQTPSCCESCGVAPRPFDSVRYGSYGGPDRGIVRARIESDPEGETGMPVVVIDGRNISWDEFGRMVATYTGFQFKLELHDLSDEI